MTLGQVNALISAHNAVHAPKQAPPTQGTVADLARFRAMKQGHSGN